MWAGRFAILAEGTSDCCKMFVIRRIVNRRRYRIRYVRESRSRGSRSRNIAMTRAEPPMHSALVQGHFYIILQKCAMQNRAHEHSLLRLPSKQKVQMRLHNRRPWMKALFRRGISIPKGGERKDTKKKKMRACKAKRHLRVRDRVRFATTML